MKSLDQEIKYNIDLETSKISIIDIGSNSIRMLIYENFNYSRVPFFNEKAVCELGKNLDKSRKLNNKGKEYALKVLKRFSEILNVSKIKNVRIIATAVLREAIDAKDFIQEVENLFNTKLRILSGNEEAEYTAEGVKVGFKNVDGLVADLGGGSLELTKVENNIITDKTSLPIGVLRLMNNPLIKKRNLSKYVRKLFKDEKWLSKKTLLYVATQLTEHEPEPDENEELAMVKVPFEEVYQRVKSGELKDSLTVAAVLKIKLMQLEGTLSI